MANSIRLFFEKWSYNPKRLFLIDSSGAFLTAFILIAILARFESIFGMPRTVLYFLFLVSCIYSMYGVCCYFLITNNWRPYLKVIVIANLIYCCLTLGLVFYFYEKLTVLGLLYFLLEVIVIGGLVLLERTALSKINNRKF